MKPALRVVPQPFVCDQCGGQFRQPHGLDGFADLSFLGEFFDLCLPCCQGTTLYRLVEMHDCRKLQGRHKRRHKL